MNFLNFSSIVSFFVISTINGYIFPCYYYYDPYMTPESIPVDVCTHIIILGCITEQNLVAEPVYEKYNCSSALEKLANLRKLNPKLKVIMSMGSNNDQMSMIVQCSFLMKQYVDSVAEVVSQFNFDGVDFDWEFPCDNDDRFKFTQLLSLLREKLGTRYTISAAIGAGVYLLENCYDIKGLVDNLDYINVMCYNFNTIYNNYTAYSSPLFARPEEKGDDATLNTNYSINYLIENHGVPREKIVLGLSTDGHTYQLVDPKKNGFHAEVTGIGFGAGWTSYPQLCALVNGGATAVYDEIAQVLYAYYDDQWFNAGGVRSGVAKAKWAKQMKLAGIFTWCLNQDDIFNICGHNVTFPVHRAISNELFY